MNDWIDVTVPLDAGTVVWPGDRAFQASRDCRLRDGAECNLTSFAMSAHAGTHVDSPLHYFDGGASMDDLSFDATIGRARVIEIAQGDVVVEDLGRHSIGRDERVLFKTTNSARVWHREPFRRDYAHITIAAAHRLGELGPALVGIDYLSVGGPDEDGTEVHRVLLAAGVWILESLNLNGVEAGDYDLVCLPLRIAGVEGAPARAVLRRR